MACPLEPSARRGYFGGVLTLLLTLGIAWADPTAAPTGESAPDRYKVLLQTTTGDVVIRVDRSWAPLAADRFHHLVTNGYYDGNSLFRVLRGYVAQWGLHSDPAVNDVWVDRTMQDEPVLHPNSRGTIAFAAAGEDTRRTQVFVNLSSNTNLDGMGFTPFGRVVKGLAVLRRAYSLYGDGPEQSRIRSEGDVYLEANWPRLDRIERAIVLQE